MSTTEGLTTSKKRLALAIIDFLNTSAKDGTLHPEDAESIEIASNVISESFKVDPIDTSALQDAIGSQNLLSIFGVYEKLKGKSTASTEGPSSATEARPATPQTAPTGGVAGTAAGPGGKEKDDAEKLKGQGNAAMQKKDYNTAIDFYTQALGIVPLNPIYLSNRAAAYSGAGRHAEAASDAEMAVAADPKYSKAWSRLGLAKWALNDAKGAMEAYKKGIDAEGNGGSEAMRKGYETAKRKFELEGGDADDIARSASPPGGGAGGMPDFSSLASMLGGGGGGQGGGGMPNFAEMMNNPMMKQMAQNIMSNPDALNSIMNNPRLREMANSFGGGRGGGGDGGAGAPGGGMPDLSSLMNDPSIAEMARNFMGGGAGRGGGAPPS